jgi:hypothetical protein
VQELEMYVIAALLVAAAIFFAYGRWSHGHHRRRLEKELAGWRRCKDYWGLRIVAGKGKSGCTAARSMRDRILPITSAPSLPLARCGRGNCRCRYAPYPERRHGTRRYSGIRRDSIRFKPAEQERRTPHDRRKSDSLWEEVKH